MKTSDLAQVQIIDNISFSTPWPENAFHFELLENPNSHCWVAEMDKLLVGFLVCWLIIDEVHIAMIAIHPDYRGRGISKAWVITGLRGLTAQGALTATLEVRCGNKVAQHLYHHFGFEQVGLRKRYYQDTREDALILTMEPLDSDYLVWLKSGAENPWRDKRKLYDT